MSDAIDAGFGGVALVWTIGFSIGIVAAGCVLNTSARVLPVLGQADFARKSISHVLEEEFYQLLMAVEHPEAWA